MVETLTHEQEDRDTPSVGDLKVWWVPQVPMAAFEVPVQSAEQGAMILNALAEYDAFQFLNNVKPDCCNAGGLVEFDGEDWIDWEHPETFEEDPEVMFPQPSLGWCKRLSQGG